MAWQAVNNEQIVDPDVLKKQITNHGGLCYGRVVNVVGLGGGNTFGLGEYVYRPIMPTMPMVLTRRIMSWHTAWGMGIVGI